MAGPTGLEPAASGMKGRKTKRRSCFWRSAGLSPCARLCPGRGRVTVRVRRRPRGVGGPPVPPTPRPLPREPRNRCRRGNGASRSRGSADPWDAVRDGGGIVIAGLWAASQWREVRPTTRWLLRSAALAITLGCLLPTLGALADEARARRQFPVLADFGARAELTRRTWSAWSSAVLEPADRRDGSAQVLHLFLSPGTYPGPGLRVLPAGLARLGVLRAGLHEPGGMHHSY